MNDWMKRSISFDEFALDASKSVLMREGTPLALNAKLSMGWFLWRKTSKEIESRVPCQTPRL